MTEYEISAGADQPVTGHIPERGYKVEPWQLAWHGLAIDQLARTESAFALSNGHLGMRGTLEEGEPRGLPGTYLNGFYEQHALPYAEAGYGYPEAGQTIVNVTDGKVIRLLVEDEPLDMRYGQAPEHARVLDFRSGTLRRRTVWVSPTGRRILLTTERLVSFAQRAVAAIRYVVEPIDGPLQLVAQSDLLANEPIGGKGKDPRVALTLKKPLLTDFATGAGCRALLAHHTKESNLHMAAAMDHWFENPDALDTSLLVEEDLARVTAAVQVPSGGRLCLTKFIAYGWSSTRSVPALRAQVDAALTGARQTGWDGLLADQRAYLDAFWETSDVEIDGDPELQQAVRFALFHVLQAGARGETRAIAAKGLTGPGYDGHAFWDTETFVLPVLTYTQPEATRDALRWRHATIDKAKARAVQLGQEGAAFPWRSINGAECSAYWPAGTAAFHVSADVAGRVDVPDDRVGDVGVDVEGGGTGGPVGGALLPADGAPREGGAGEPQRAGPLLRSVQSVQSPPQRPGRRLRQRVRQHRQHERLGVPERVPVVAGSGQSLGGDHPGLHPGARLQHLEQREPDRLLHLGVALDPDVRAAPERVEELPLPVAQPLPAGELRTGQRRPRLVTQRGQ